MVPAPRLVAQNHREETANGGGPWPVGPLRPKLFPAGKARKRAPIWQAVIFSSLALNITLLVHIHHYIHGQPATGAAPHHKEHQACLVLPDAGSGGGSRPGKQGSLVYNGGVARAPSTGKPAVTPDSVINLDQ